MKRSMNAFKNSDAVQKLLGFGFQAIGYVVTISLAAFLILAWILTAPLFRLGVCLSDFTASMRQTR